MEKFIDPDISLAGSTRAIAIYKDKMEREQLIIIDKFRIQRSYIMYEVDSDDDDRNFEHTGRKKGLKTQLIFHFGAFEENPRMCSIA